MGRTECGLMTGGLSALPEARTALPSTVPKRLGMGWRFGFADFLRRLRTPIVTDVWKLSVKIRFEDPDAVGERRMGFEQADERFGNTIAKKHVRQFLGMGMTDTANRFRRGRRFFSARR